MLGALPGGVGPPIDPGISGLVRLARISGSHQDLPSEPFVYPSSDATDSVLET